MPTTVREENLKLMYLGIREMFENSLRSLRKPYYSQMSHLKLSDKYEEDYLTIGNLPPAQQKADGGSISYGTVGEGYKVTIKNKTYVNGVSFSLEFMEDDTYKVSDLFKGAELARTMQTQRELAFADAFNSAGTTLGPDGVAQASAAHPLLGSELKNNNLVTGGLTAANLLTARNRFNQIKNHSGELMDTEATLLVAHPDKMALVMTLLESELKALEQSNASNTVSEYIPLRAAFNKYINSTSYPWALMDMNMEDAGFVFQRRKGITTDYWQDSKATQNFYFNVHERYGVGVISPGYGFVWSAGGE